MFTDSLARSASEIATQNAVKAIREVDLDRQVDVTLVGGRSLNTGRNKTSRPVQTCIYVVSSADWRPPPWVDGTDCAAREREPGVLAVERRFVAPSQVQQFQMKAPGVREAWVVVDADFSLRPTDYLPLRLRVDGHGLVRVSAWLDGNVISDGSKPLPGPTQTSDGSTEAVAAGVAAPVVAQAAAPAPVATDPASAARAARMEAARPKALRSPPAEAPRRIQVTLVGGRRLNAQRGAPAQPVRTCSYVVTRPDWHPPAPEASTSWASDHDPDVLAFDCRLVAPNQLLQFSLDLRASAASERWLLIDADYAQRPASYAPLRLRLDAAAPQVSAWLEAKAIFDGRQPLPQQAAAEPDDPGQAPVPAPARPPLQPLPSSPLPTGVYAPRPDPTGGPQ